MFRPLAASFGQKIGFGPKSNEIQLSHFSGLRVTLRPDSFAEQILNDLHSLTLEFRELSVSDEGGRKSERQKFLRPPKCPGRGKKTFLVRVSVGTCTHLPPLPSFFSFASASQSEVVGVTI